MKRAAWVWAAIAAAGCGGNLRRPPGGGHDMGPPGPPGCFANADRDTDQDQDGYTPNQGDCNDCSALINPGAMQIPGDATDYACNGQPGVVAACDTGLAGTTDGASLAKAMGFCDSRFLLSATLVQPTNIQARQVVQRFGQILPKDGAAMALISTGVAADKTMAGYVDPQTGTALDYTNEVPNPDPSVPSVPGCSMLQPPKVNDYAELLVKLRAPTNAHSFSFNFQFFSAEYPEFVCTEFNDEFLVMMESQGEFQTATNISFDARERQLQAADQALHAADHRAHRHRLRERRRLRPTRGWIDRLAHHHRAGHAGRAGDAAFHDLRRRRPHLRFRGVDRRLHVEARLDRWTCDHPVTQTVVRSATDCPQHDNAKRVALSVDEVDSLRSWIGVCSAPRMEV